MESQPAKQRVDILKKWIPTCARQTCATVLHSVAYEHCSQVVILMFWVRANEVVPAGRLPQLRKLAGMLNLGFEPDCCKSMLIQVVPAGGGQCG